MMTAKELRVWGEDNSFERRDAWETLLLEIDERISLTSTQYEGLRSRYEAIGAILEDPFDGALGDIVLIPQGSFRTRTVTRPPGRDDVDVDAVAYVRGGTVLAPVELLDRLFDELDRRARTGGRVESYKRCVRIQYNDGSLPCHVDVTPAERRPGNAVDNGSGLLRVPDRSTQWWSPSNPVDFADWFEEIAETALSLRVPESYQQLVIAKRGATEPLPSHEEITAPNGLRVTVRLMKRHRDVYVDRTRCKASKPISVLVTTLAGKAYARVAARVSGQILTPLQLIEMVAQEMPSCFDDSTPTERYRLLNPRDRSENFAEKWNADPALRATFYAWYESLVQTLRLGLVNFPSKDRFRRELTDAFGTSAGVACDDFFAQVRGGTYPGLSEAAADRARVAGRSAAIVGLGRREPSRAAQPKPLDRLG